MTTPSDLVSISQTDINNWAGAIQTATTAIQSLVASGTLQPAQEDTMNAAITALETASGTLPATPPPAGP